MNVRLEFVRMKINVGQRNRYRMTWVAAILGVLFAGTSVLNAAVFEAGDGSSSSNPTLPGEGATRDTTGWDRKFDVAKLDLLMSTARAYFDKGESISAIDTLKKADALSPFNPVVLLALAQCHMARDEMKEAVRYALSVIEVAPRFASAYVMLGYAYLKMDDIQGAVNTYEKFIKNDSTNAKAYSGLALVRAMQGRDEEAEILFKQALEIDEEDGHTHEMLGNLLQRKNAHKEAVEHYRVALQTRTGEWELHNAIATSLYVLKEREEAIHHYQRAIQIRPNFSKPYRNLTLLLMETNQKAEAIAVALTALKLDFGAANAWRNYMGALLNTIELPKDFAMEKPPEDLEEAKIPEWYHGQGLHYLKSTNVTFAAVYLAEALAKDPGNPGYYNDFGALVTTFVSPDLGLPFFMAASMVGSGNQSARVNLDRAMTDINIRNRQQRIMELSQAVKEEAGNTGPNQFELGRLYAEFNMVTNALPHFAEAVKLIPEEVAPRIDYAQALFITGKPDEAIKQINEAMKRDKDNPLIQHRLAWLLINKPDSDSLHFTFARDLLIKANSTTHYLETNFLRNLAKAYNLNNEFSEAVEIGKLALQRADELGNGAMVKVLGEELSEYQKNAKK